MNGSGSWVICSKTDTSWYNYGETEKQWANVMLCDGTYNESTPVGTEVAEEDLGSMFVWIPRFAYKITAGYHNNTTAGMDVKFLVGRSNKTIDNATIVDYNATTTNNYSKFPDGYVIHPAFKDGSSTGYSNGEWKTEILGLWVAKFQAGIKTTDKDTSAKVSSVSNYYYPVFKGRKFGYNHVNASQCYNISLALDDDANPYRLTSLSNSHLMKNSEWGAAAYLSMSQYGYSGGTITTETEIARNNLTLGNTVSNPNNTAKKIRGVTGYSAPGTKTGENRQTFVSVEETLKNEVGNSTVWTVVNTGTDTGAGTKSSTTGNIYGIYDMSFCISEYVAAYVNNTSATAEGRAFATGTSTWLATAYPNKATTSLDFNRAYDANEFREIYGDAIWETSKNVGSGLAWFQDSLEADTGKNEVFFPRGNSSNTGLCGIIDHNGSAIDSGGFRSVLVIE